MASVLDSRRLLAFSAVARLGSFTLAARELGLTQGGVSHALKALEQELGYRLFERGPRRATLTAAGSKLQGHVEKILQEMAAVRTELPQADDPAPRPARRRAAGAATLAAAG
jgi:DNA-binding transcriptional LysR family regulator